MSGDHSDPADRSAEDRSTDDRFTDDRITDDQAGDKRFSKGRPSPSSVGVARWFRLCKKELLETLRDRRTIVTLLLMPLLVYPLLSMALNRFLLTGGGETTAAYRIGLGTEPQAEFIRGLLDPEIGGPPTEIVEASGGKMAEFSIFITSQSVDDSGNSTPVPGPTPREALRRELIELALEVESDPEGNPDRITAICRSGDVVSENARRIFLERLQWFRLRTAERQAANPVSIAIDLQTIGSAPETPLLATIIPLVLVLMTITGAVYPAIDLTAGERERGTMEALMASPIPPFSVLGAKYVAVIAVALLTAVANLLAMFTTLWIGGLLPMLTGGDSFPFVAVGWIFLLLILFASFFSAVLLSLTSFARSFKEAQAYLIPVMLLSITPGMLSLLPGVTLAGPLAVAPLINIVLLARETLAGTVSAPSATIAVVSTLAYAAAALGLASRLFGSDAVDRSGGGSFASMFRRPESISHAPTPPAAAFALAMLVPIYFVVSGSLLSYLSGIKEVLRAGADDLTMQQAATLQIRSMVLSAIALVIVFGGVPLLVSVLQRCRLRTTYRLRPFPLASLLGCLTIAVSAWILAHEAFVLYTLAFGGLDAEKIEQTRKVVEAWTMVPPWIMLLTLALTPAVVEELCFRGFLFSAFRRSLSTTKIILLTSLLFGLFHVVTGSALLVERFVPSTLLGLILGWVAYRTGSVFPGMLLHFTHNGLLNLVGHYHKQLDLFDQQFDNQSHLPPQWIAGGFICVAMGMLIVWWSTRGINGSVSV